VIIKRKQPQNHKLSRLAADCQEAVVKVQLSVCEVIELSKGRIDILVLNLKE
jgi:hypothetical protein